MGNANDLVATRMALCAQDIRLVLVRVSDDNVQRDSLITSYRSTDWLKTSIQLPSDVPWTGFLVRFESGSLYRASRLMRGVPDVDVAEPSVVGFGTNFGKAFQKFADKLQSASWCLKAIEKGPSNPLVNIVSIDFTQTPWVATTGVHNIPQGAKVRLSGVVASIKANGLYQVASANNTHLSLLGTTANPDALYFRGGNIRQQIYQPQLITSATILRQGKRDTGRSVFTPVGRHRRKK